MRNNLRRGLRHSLAWAVVALAAGCGGSSAGRSGNGSGGGSDAGAVGASDGGSTDGGTTDGGDLKSALPSNIGGTTLDVQSFAGTQIADPADDAWKQALVRIGASASDLTLAVSVPPQHPASDLQLGAFRIARTDWNARLSALVTAANAAGMVTFTQVQLGGKSVQRGQINALPTGPKGYYYVAGDILFFITATNEAEAVEALGKINAAAATARSEASPASAGVAPATLPPPTGIILFSRLQTPLHPLCVGEPANPGSSFMFLLTDGNAIPTVAGGAQVQATYGRAFPPATAGAVSQFYYQATSWAGGNGSLIAVEAFSGLYGDHARLSIIPPELLVLQCLSGTAWMDGDRVIKIVAKGSSFTAVQTSGSLTCGPPGETFSGAFTGAQISGSDLTACNPPACVSAGLLSRTATTTFQGTMSDDGLSIAMNWDAPIFKLTYDNGNLISCTPLPAVPETFSLTRPFSEPWSP